MLVKRMMSNKLPDKVLFERMKGLQSTDIAYRVKKYNTEITESIKDVFLSPAAHHYIDLKKIERNWNEYLQKPGSSSMQVQRILKSLHFAQFLKMNF